MWSNIVKNEDTVVVSEVESEVESVISNETSSDDSTECDDFEYIISNGFSNRCWKDEEEAETFGWTVNPIENTIKRFRLKKLKSVNQKNYLYDNVYHYIWEFNQDVKALIKPSNDLCMRLRALNEIASEPFLEQPIEFW